MSKNGNKKLTSVKVDIDLWDEFKVECVRRKFSFQKLSERSIDLFLNDEEFRRLIINHTSLEGK